MGGWRPDVKVLLFLWRTGKILTESLYGVDQVNSVTSSGPLLFYSWGGNKSRCILFPCTLRLFWEGVIYGQLERILFHCMECLAGHYTRSGYVPGPICKYNWTKVWDVVDSRNGHASSEVSFKYIASILFKMKLFQNEKLEKTHGIYCKFIIALIRDHNFFLDILTWLTPILFLCLSCTPTW